MELPVSDVIATGGNESVPVVKEKEQEMLWDAVEESRTDLNQDEKQFFYHLLLSYADDMTCSISDLGGTDKLQHHIHTGSATPIRQPVHHVPPPRRNEVRKLLKDMLDKKVIEPSTSAWASLVQKRILCGLLKGE